MFSKKRKNWKRFMAYFLVVLFGSFFLMVGCVSFRTSDKKVKKSFLKKSVEVRVYHQKFEDVSIRWIESGLTKADAPLIIFIHGAPGSSNAFDKYLQDSAFIDRARLVSVDRLGYGYSDYGNAEESIARHAKQIKSVVDFYAESNKIILVGHSFGGPIVAKVMMDFPELVDVGVMLAPAVDPDHEKIMWIANFTKWKATRWLFSGAIKVSSDEKFSHISELEKMDAEWSNIQRPIIHIHGTKDNLVPYPNLPYVKEKLADSLLTPISWKGANHLIVWNRYEDVKRIILVVL